MMWRIGVPVSRTCGLLAFDRSPAIAITDFTRTSRQHSRNPTPNEMTSPSEWPAAAMRSASTMPGQRVVVPEREHLADHERRVAERLVVVDVAGATVGAAQDRVGRRGHDVAGGGPALEQRSVEVGGDVVAMAEHHERVGAVTARGCAAVRLRGIPELRRERACRRTAEAPVG